MITKILGFVILLIALSAIAAMIFGGFQIAIDAVEQDAKDNEERRAKALAAQMYDEAIRNTRINIIQRVVVVDESEVCDVR